MLTAGCWEAMLDLMFPTGTGNTRATLSLHTAYSATGANMHGSKTTTEAAWAAASGRSKGLTSTVDLPVTAGTTIKWIGIWGYTSAQGDTFRGMVPNGGSDKSFQIDTTANNKILCEGHGYVGGDKVVFHNDTAPGGLTAGTTYVVYSPASADPDTFQVAEVATPTTPIDITSEAGANCVVSKIIEETYGSNGTHRINTLTISL